jgi:peptide deformylase
MARLPILEYPDPRLRIRAEPVTKVDADIKKLVADMFETMYGAPGIGLAATQVNVHKRLLVVDVSEQRDQPYCLINPEIIASEGEIRHEEGCLSVPGFFEHISRAEKIRVRALNADGEPFELEAEGLLAVCIQHEMDHLNGKLFVDYLSPLKRERFRKKLLKQAKRGGAGQAAEPVAQGSVPVI